MEIICAEFVKYSSILDGSVIREWRREFGEIDQRLADAYLTPMFSLSLLSRINATSNAIDASVLDALTIVLTNHEGFLAMSTSETSCISLVQKALYLLQLCGDTRNTRSSILLLLSFAYLQKVKRHNTNYDDSSASLVAVYSSVLYYITGQYKKAIVNCRCVLRLYSAQSQHVAYVAEGECLPKISDDVDNVSGLAVLYQYVYVKFSGRDSHTAHVNVFSAHLFAHYLMLESRRYLERSENSVKRAMMKQYKSDFCNTLNPFVTDLMLLYVFCKTRFAQDDQLSQSTKSIPLQFKAREFNRLLVAHSVEHLTSIRQVLSRDFISLCEIATTDLEAMLDYKCGLYERCFQLNKRNLEILSTHSMHLSVPLMGCMTHVLDDNLASLHAAFSMVSKDDSGNILQMTLTVYMLALVELKRCRHAVHKVIDMLRIISILQQRSVGTFELNRLVLSFVYRKTVVGLSKILMC
jgi:hypothetical protein